MLKTQSKSKFFTDKVLARWMNHLVLLLTLRTFYFLLGLLLGVGALEGYYGWKLRFNIGFGRKFCV